MGKLVEGIINKAEYPNFSYIEDKGIKYRFKGGIKGQKVLIKPGKKMAVTKSKLISILEKSPLEKEKGCPMLNDCGGCKFQELSLDDEYNYKKDMINDLYKPVWSEPINLVKSPQSFAYRNKMEYTFGDTYKGGPLVLGLHMKNRFYEILDNEYCNIVNEGFNAIRSYTQDFFREKQISFYHKIRQEGSLKFFIIRYSFYQDAFMLNLVTATSPDIDKPLFEEYLQGIKSLPYKVVSIYHTISDSSSDAVKPDKINHIWGDEYLIEELHGLLFKISPFSFFQPNPKGAQNLFKKALQCAGDISNKTVYDLYSGTGTISQIFAQKARSVVGVEIVKEAVEKAKENAKLNNLTNLDFRANDVLLEIENLKESPDILVLDPPREGIHPKAIDKIISMEAEKIIYISCNPVTQVRDLKIFKESGYRIEEIEAYDQFVRTFHVETVVLLSHKKPDSQINVKVEFGEENGKFPIESIAEKAEEYKPKEKVTYKMIQSYIKEKYNLKMHTAYIAEVKRSLGIQMQIEVKTEGTSQNKRSHPSKEKVEIIKDALLHFNLI